MTDFPRLIEFAFPLKQASLDSVHEKNVRHGHISTLHIWPARRPLAACRAALIATLLPDPGTPEKRKELCEKIAGKVVKRIERKKMPNGQTVERVKEETEGGILHWGRETENADDLEWFRQEIKKAYGGRAPKVLDPFAGGGAIPLEAMRLGCEATAVDINPVAWFILKCTLEYPQKFAGKTWPLPAFILENEEFMEAFYKANPDAEGQGRATIKQRGTLFAASEATHAPDADLAWHVRAWGQWVLGRARKELAGLYPTYAEFEALVGRVGRPIPDGSDVNRGKEITRGSDATRGAAGNPGPSRDGNGAVEVPDATHRADDNLRLVPLNDDGTPNINALNAEFSKDYLADKRNPRWVAKPTVAYLWARTVKCKNCRSQLPLLKTRWLCKKDRKRVLLTMRCEEVEATGPSTPEAVRAKVAAKLASPATAATVENPSSTKRVIFGIQADVPVSGGNAAQKREYDKRIAGGTMSRAGARCPCCPAIMTMEDIRAEGMADRRGSVMTAVVVDGPDGKEYRLPTEHELSVAIPEKARINQAFADVPFGVPEEPLVRFGVPGGSYGFPVVVHGFDKWRKLFTSRQLTALGTFVSATRAARQAMAGSNYSPEWVEAVGAYLACVNSRTADYMACLCVWEKGAEEVKHVFMRWALPITWDFAEANPLSPIERFFVGGITSAHRTLSSLLPGLSGGIVDPQVENRSAILPDAAGLDIVFTDPPYYDAIPYSDLMDFFYVWLRRSLLGLSPGLDGALRSPLAPKWDHEANDGELIDDCSRHGLDATKSKASYESGMARVFLQCTQALNPDGRMVIVFANKQPEAWETLVAAVIRSGFAVDGSWPITTEMPGGLRNLGRASLASSVWLVCKKRPANARPGWDNAVLEEMRANIAAKLRDFWDAGIRGPDFVWAATGPALEAYSKHPVVRKADQPNATMSVGEFLTHVRRMVVDYVVGQVLHVGGGADSAAAERLDEVTAYYVLHRNDFNLDDAPVGACILYATACGLSDTELEKTWEILSRAGSVAEIDASEAEESHGSDDDSDDAGGGSKVRLKAWSQRHGKSIGYDAPGGKPIPLIDRIHRLMHLWKQGDVHKVDEYLDASALRKNELFKRVVQSLIELSENSERSILESISNHVGARGTRADADQMKMGFAKEGT